MLWVISKPLLNFHGCIFYFFFSFLCYHCIFVFFSFGSFMHVSLLYASLTQSFRRNNLLGFIFHHNNVALAVINILEFVLLLNSLTVTLLLKTFPVNIEEKYELYKEINLCLLGLIILCSNLK